MGIDPKMDGAAWEPSAEETVQKYIAGLKKAADIAWNAETWGEDASHATAIRIARNNEKVIKELDKVTKEEEEG